MRFAYLSFLVMVSVVGGCNSAASPATTAACTANVSGAVTFPELPCTENVGVDANGDGNGVVVIGFVTPPMGYQIEAGFTLPGGPAVATYTSLDGTPGTCVVAETGPAESSWEASTRSQIGLQGSFSVTLTEAGPPLLGTADAAQFDLLTTAHGSITCTMPPVATTSASGTTTLTVTF